MAKPIVIRMRTAEEMKKLSGVWTIGPFIRSERHSAGKKASPEPEAEPTKPPEPEPNPEPNPETTD